MRLELIHWIFICNQLSAAITFGLSFLFDQFVDLGYSDRWAMAWFDNLELGPFLGAGSFGYVFKTFSAALLDNTRTTTALKFILQDSHLTTENRNDLEVAQLLAVENHSNVVPILNITKKSMSISDLDKLLDQFPSDYEGRPLEDLTMLKYRANKYKSSISGICIQMRLCGPSLRQWLNEPVQRRMSPIHLHQTQVDIIAGLVEGLRYLHSKNIVHTDLRPEVILFSEPNFPSEYRSPVMLGGFGHCCINNGATGTSSSSGHRVDSIYSAPEQSLLDGAATSSQAVDLFSLGLIMWEVLQSMKPNHVRNLFYELVSVGNVSRVEEHQVILNAKELIIGLTKRRVVDRIKTMDNVQLVLRKGSYTLSKNIEDNWPENLKIGRLLGHGAFGTVMECPTNNTAIKVIFLGDEGSDAAHRVTREYFVPVGKQHPNVIEMLRFTVHKFTPAKILSFFQSTEMNNNDSLMDAIQYRVDRAQARNCLIPTFCLEMELCGKNLRSWLQTLDGDPDSKTLVETQFQIATQLVKGLQFLHSHKIIHRDLKPENILFSQPDYTLPVKIGDFGLVRYLPGGGFSVYLTPNVGTSLYRAPEVGTDSYGHPADIFSLGLVLWEVFQRLDRGLRKCLFFKLVHDYDAVEEAGLVQNHALVKDVPQLILKMTQRLVKDRVQSLDDVIISRKD